MRVRYLHATRRMVVAVRAFDAETGAYLRDYTLAEDEDNMASDAVEGRRPTVRPGSVRPVDRGSSGSAPGRVGDIRDRREDDGNNGVAVGRRDAGRGESAVGNGRADSEAGGKPENVGDRGNDDRNNGVAVGRRDAGRGASSVQNSRDDEKTAGGRGNSVDNTSTRVQQKPAAADSTPRGRVAGVDSARRGGRAAPSDARGRGSVTSTSDVQSDAGANDRRSDIEDAVSPIRRVGSTDAHEAVDDRDEPRVQDLEALGIERRFLPDPGMCRIWVPNLAHGRQARARRCDGVLNVAPAGAWILRRSLTEPNLVNVDYVDEERAGVIVRSNVFKADSHS